jgi:hypothetical protein
MTRLLAAAVAAMTLAPVARADTQMTVVTDKGYVAFVVGDDWAVLSMKTKTPVSAAVYQIPNAADAETPESTNLVLMLYDLTTQAGRAEFEKPVPDYSENEPVESEYQGWTVYRHFGMQNDVEYTILDARRRDVGDGEVAAGVRLSWPHLPDNREHYDAEMESTFRSFLTGVQGHVGPWTPREGEVAYRAEGGR